MFDIGASELLLTVIVAIVVIGPKDLPRALRMAGGWIAKVRRVSGHFRSGIEEMIRQAELEEMEKKWREKNEAIMKEEAAAATVPAASAEAALAPPQPADVVPENVQPADPHGAALMTAPTVPASPEPGPDHTGPDHTAPELPLGPPKAPA